MTLSLPDPISSYFELSNGSDTVRIDRCFTQNAFVVDERHTHRGLAAIQSWMREARKKFEYTVEPINVSRDDDRVTVATNVVGNFPGSPVQLDHVFELTGDKIRSLEIR